MDNADIQLVGGPCGQHGPYTFYKAFKYTKNGMKRIVTLSEFFFVKLWIDSDLLCIGELQLLWSDKNSEQVLASLRLYFLPENTPEGRMDHGEDEVLAISEKVVLRVEDLITWITVDAEWTWGRLARCEKDVKEPPKSEEGKNNVGSLTESSLDFSDVEKERKLSDGDSEDSGQPVVILSYPRYCRYRAMMRRLEGVENEYLKYKIVNALGGFTSCTKNTRVLFCKDTFDYPELEGHELLCNHLAPKLKGRPRGKRKKRSVSPGSESNESESSVSNVFNSSKDKITAEGGKNGILRRSTRAVENNESKEFLKELATFMKTNYTPIGKIPSLGYKELDLYAFYNKVQKLGGYDAVTSNKLWKSLFDEMSGHANSTSAATVIRRHYERFLLPYERHIKGEEYKPLPISERRRLKSKTGGSSSDAETSESTSRSGNSTPIPTPTTPTENKEFTIQVKPGEAKPSSLRSVRVKSERQKDKQVSGNESEVKEEVKSDVVAVKAEETLPEKDAEPLTSAETPHEGKENIPIGEEKCKSPEVIEVPYKAKSPEVIDLEADSYNSSGFLQDVKKRKLEILKEGGLEVTPVRSKEVRPSVIQKIKSEMPPPPVTMKRMTPINVPQSINISQIKIEPKSNFTYVNGNGPPRVLQSKSIYSYSEKTVYGNPKDYVPTTHNVHTPKFVGPKQTDILDLTTTSPQKPVVEIMKIPTKPQVPLFHSPAKYNRVTPPILEGRRLGSNLEITLVGSNKPPDLHQPKYVPSYPPKYTQKRIASEPYPNNKFPKMEKSGMEITIPQYRTQEPAMKIPQQMAPPKPPRPAPIPFPYMPPLYDSNKNLPQYPFAMLDPLYLTAMQNLYPVNHPHSVPRFSSPEQVKLYTDMMVHTSRLNFPYPIGPEGNPSIINNNVLKKQ